MEGPSSTLQQSSYAHRRTKVLARRVTADSASTLRRQDGEDVFAWGKTWCFSSTYSRFACTSCCGDVRRDGERPIGDRDYRRTEPPRLVLPVGKGEITSGVLLSGSSKDLTRASTTNFTADICRQLGPEAAFQKVRAVPPEEISDVLLDQAIFAGWVTSSRNEVLFPHANQPFRSGPENLRPAASRHRGGPRTFSMRFLSSQAFVLRKNLEIYQRSACRCAAAKSRRRVHG